MKAELKSLESPDVDDLRKFMPEHAKHFSLFVEAMIGPAGDDSSESFYLNVCTPLWLADEAERVGPLLGFHYIIVPFYDYDALFGVVQGFCSRCESEDWREIGQKLGRIGKWELDEYRERAGHLG